MTQPKTLGTYAKGINAAIILVLGVLVTGFEDGSLNTIEYIACVVALLRGVLNFGVRPEWGKVGVYLPLILTALIGAATQLTVALQDGEGFSQPELITVLVVFFTALGSTFATSNARLSDAINPAVPD